MATTTNATYAPSYPVVAPATLTATVNILKAAMAVNAPINASDLAKIYNDFYAYWRAHSHGLADLRGWDTFGNVTAYTTSGTYIYAATADPLSVPSLAVYGPLTVPTGIAAAQPVTASDINQIITLINGMRNHLHSWFDTDS